MARFMFDLCNGAGEFGAARVGHHTKRTELVASLLHGDESGDTAPARSRRRRFGEMIELVLDGKLGLDHRAILGARDQVGEAMIVL